jgi:hypothetical protein
MIIDVLVVERKDEMSIDGQLVCGVFRHGQFIYQPD